MIFGDDYVKFREHLVEGWFLYIKGQVQENRFRGGMEFKITLVELLTDVKEKLARRLRILLDLERLDEDLGRAVADLVEAHPGNTSLTFEIFEEGKGLEMPARQTKVALDKALVAGLDALEGVRWKIQMH
jgi:DNA polymerase-3 subunit alpha